MTDNKYSIAIIGNKETILGFKALGLKTFNANSGAEAVNALFDIKAETIKTNDGEERPAYAIAFITEELAMQIPKDDYKKLSQDALPAIVPIPSSKGATGHGMKRIGQMVEQAVGSDIFAN